MMGERIEFCLCDHCPRRRKCSAYSCNMMKELDLDFVVAILDYKKEIGTKLIKEWMKTNKIVIDE